MPLYAKHAVRHCDDEPEPAEWQKRLLELTNVYEINGPSTCVYLDENGKLLQGHDDYRACIPIEYFAPDPESEKLLGAQLVAQLYAHTKDAQKKCPRNKASREVTDYGPVLETIDVEGIRDHLRKARGFYGEEYVFQREDRDKLQINKMFVEMMKYPEVAYTLFRGGLYSAVVGNVTHDISKLTHNYKSKDTQGGYFDPSCYTIAAAMQPNYSREGSMAERTCFDQLVAEEMLHALDNWGAERDGALSEHMSSEFLPLLEAHANKLQNLLERIKREYQTDTPETYTEAESAFKENLLKLAESNSAVMMKLGYPWKRNKHETAIAILEKGIENINEGHEFVKDELYDDLSENGVRSEMFAKLAKHVLLSRHTYQHADAAAYKAVEDYLYTPRDEHEKVIEPNPLKDVRQTLDKFKAEYLHKRSEEQRAQEGAFTKHIVTNTEKWSPGSTGYAVDKTAKKGYY